MVELGKLYDALIQFRYARTRLTKNGYREPEPSQIFEILRALLAILTSKDLKAHLAFQLYITNHSSINGLMSEQMVDEMYGMMLEHARKYVDGNNLHAGVRALQPRAKETFRRPMDGKGYSSENTCFNCGSKDH